MTDIPGLHRKMTRLKETPPGGAVKLVLLRAEDDLIVSELFLLPSETLAGHAVNYSTLQVFNKGTDGSKSDKIAEIAFTLGEDRVAYVPFPIPIDTAYEQVLKGEVLEFQKIEAAGGMNLPADVLDFGVKFKKPAVA